MPARVVNVASTGQLPIDFDDLMIERGYSGSRAYGQSKLAQMMSAFELADRLSAAEVTVDGPHPPSGRGECPAARLSGPGRAVAAEPQAGQPA